MSENRWAVLVGVSKSRGHPELQYAAADAIDFAKEIVSELGFDRKRVLVLADPRDDQGSDFRPTRNNLFHALGLIGDTTSDFYTAKELAPMGEDDLFLFYFSGHGMRAADRTEHLLGVDASPYDTRATAVPLESVVDHLEKLPCRHKVLFLDMCRDELFDAAGGGAKSADGAKGIGQQSVVEREGLATFYSCDPRTRSYEINDLKHGSFTHCLIEAIKHEKVNTLEELDEYLKSRVPTVNAEYQKEPQQPHLVLQPADMRKLDLFRVAVPPDEHGDLIQMTTELLEQGQIDVDLWRKLTGVWEAGPGSVPFFVAKTQIFRAFFEGKLDDKEFLDALRKIDRPNAGTITLRPQIKLRRSNGDDGDADAGQSG